MRFEVERALFNLSTKKLADPSRPLSHHLLIHSFAGRVSAANARIVEPLPSLMIARRIEERALRRVVMKGVEKAPPSSLRRERGKFRWEVGGEELVVKVRR
ncbi:hypothetical protein HDU67_004775 [Dinochytrium kinnereticum]|nr:hypothetical protein HDU67_004775 [Dinochytrium kinnereticum]